MINFYGQNLIYEQKLSFFWRLRSSRLRNIFSPEFLHLQRETFFSHHQSIPFYLLGSRDFTWTPEGRSLSKTNKGKKATSTGHGHLLFELISFSFLSISFYCGRGLRCYPVKKNNHYPWTENISYSLQWHCPAACVPAATSCKTTTD